MSFKNYSPASDRAGNIHHTSSQPPLSAYRNRSEQQQKWLQQRKELDDVIEQKVA